MKGEYNFNKDILKGEEGEDTIIKYMQNLGFQFMNKCNDNRFDFCMSYNNKEYTYELKTDMYCTPKNDTGNIVVEVECRGKDSGLSVTHAEYFITYFPYLGEIWNIKTEALKKLVNDFELPLKDGRGDPGSNTKFFLIKKNAYRHHFKIHKI